MRNAGTRRKEMHVSPQAQTGKQRARVREAAQGHIRGLPGVPTKSSLFEAKPSKALVLL